MSLSDCTLIAGLLLAAAGGAMVSIPATLIVLGATLAVGAIVLERGS